MSQAEGIEANQPSTDGKLMKVRGGFKSAFNRLKKTVDESTHTAMEARSRVFKSVALLEAMQDKVGQKERLNAETGKSLDARQETKTCQTNQLDFTFSLLQQKHFCWQCSTFKRRLLKERKA